MPSKDDFQNLQSTLDVAIPVGTAITGDIFLGGTYVVGIQMPTTGNWTTANLTFQASVDGTTWEDVYDNSGTEVTVVAAAARYIFLTPADFAGMKYIRIRSGTTGTPVTQTPARTLKLVLRPL